MMQDSNVITTDHSQDITAYQITPFLMTFSDFQGYVPSANL